MNHDQSYPDSFYVTTLNKVDFPALDEQEIKADSCVIGGGLAGLNTALGLIQRGQSVALLDARKIAWGASGRNGGFLASGYALGVEDIIKKLACQQRNICMD